jgi:hypothetical protein
METAKCWSRDRMKKGSFICYTSIRKCRLRGEKAKRLKGEIAEL